MLRTSRLKRKCKGGTLYEKVNVKVIRYAACKIRELGVERSTNVNFDGLFRTQALELIH